jgi:hypothetical protein
MMGTNGRPNLEEIRRNVEDALRSFDAGTVLEERPPPDAAECGSGDAVAPPEATFQPLGASGPEQGDGTAAADRIQKIGNVSAMAVMEASEITASDIEQTGQIAVDLAAEIMKEAKELASGLRANGAKMSEHLQEFAVLAKKVSTIMRDAREEVLNPPGLQDLSKPE